MKIHILSLFGESMRPYLDTSTMKRAQEKELFEYELHNLADWSVKNTRRVDDRPYGGGAGTVITIAPLTHAIRDICLEYGDMPLFLMNPRGRILDQTTLESCAATFDSCMIICGHYEGIDERIFKLFPTLQSISLGQYVISSGELAALVFIDGMVRLIPGVISDKSLQEESWSKQLQRNTEYPQYSRPQIFEGFPVPKELVSGNHDKIVHWKKKFLIDSDV